MNKTQFKQFLKEKGKKEVIFDFDGTLCTLNIEWLPYWWDKMRALFLKYDPSLTNPEINNVARIQNQLIEQFGEAVRKEIIEINYFIEKNYNKGYTKHAILLEIFHETVKLLPVHIWSSNDKRTLEPVLKEVGIHHLITTLITRNDVTFIKPHHNGFEVINKHNQPPEQFLLIGDAHVDEAAAKSAGIEFIHISQLSL